MTGVAVSPLAKIAGMGTVLAVLCYLAFFHDFGSNAIDPTEVNVLPVPTVSTPTLDPDVMATIADESREKRLVLEPEPLAHLLATSLNVSSAVGQALGMPKDPVPVEFVRTEPSYYRGQYLWFKGELEKLEGPAPGHPVEGYSVYTALIRTPGGEPIQFYFSLEPLADGLQVGDWVRVEGYFFKLRDMVFPTRIEKAPVMVGARLRPAFEDWGEVTAFDADLLRSVRDVHWVEGEDGSREWVPQVDGERTLIEDQAEPLWNLAAYARSETGGTLEQWRAHPALDLERFKLLRDDDNRDEVGTPYRVMGTFIFASRFRAPPNPAGIEHWSEAWIQVHDLGGKLIPLWIAQDIGSDWQRGDPVEARVFYYKRLSYEPEFGDATQVLTPVFVGARLDRYRAADQPLASTIGWIFLGISIFVVGLFIFVARRDRTSSARFEEKRTERRRRMRARHAGAIVTTPGDEATEPGTA